MSKKLIGVVLGLALFAVALPASAAGLTQAQIQSILGLLQSFGAEQSVINKVAVTLGGSAPVTNTQCVQLTRNLTIGTTGEEVSRLQKYLTEKGFFSNEATGYYGFVTAQAVGKLQISLGIVLSQNDPAYGMMGPRTREAVKCGGTPNASASITADVDGGTYLNLVYKNLPPSKLYLVRDAPNEALDTLDKAEGSGGLQFNLKGKPAGNYFVRAVGDGIDIRTATFYISGQTSASSMQILSPNGGEVYNLDQSLTLKWAATNVPSGATFVVEFQRQDGDRRQVSKVITDGVQRSYTIPSLGEYGDSSLHLVPGTYRVVMWVGNVGENQSARDVSDGTITITSPASNTLSVELKVNGSEGPVYVNDGQPITVQWASSGADRCQLANVRTSSTGAATYLYNLPTAGSRTLYAVGAGFAQGSVDSFVNIGCYKGANAEQNPTQTNSAVDIVAIRASQTPQATATIDQSSLSQNTGNFRINGSASNATSLQIIMVTGNYTGATDWNSANAAVRANSVYNVNSTARVENGRWVGVFGSGSGGAGVPAGTYTLLVYDLSQNGATPSVVPRLLTRNLLTVQYSTVNGTPIPVPTIATSSTAASAQLRLKEELCAPGSSVCPVTITWSARNVQQAVLQGAGPLWPTGSNIDGPNTDLVGIKSLSLPSGEYLFSVSGFDGASWGKPLNTITYRRMQSIPQNTALSIAPAGGCDVPAGATTCRVTVTWNTSGYYHSVLQGAGPLWPTGSNIDGPVSSAPTLSNKTVSFDLPVGTHIFSISGFDGTSWGTPKSTINYIVRPN